MAIPSNGLHSNGYSLIRNIINVNDERDWELVENHIEEHLRMYSSVEKVIPVSCKKCGRLIEYVSHL